VHHPDQCPAVAFRINLLRVAKVDTVEGQVRVSIQVVLYWCDERLCGYENLLLPPKMWTPTLYPLNFVGQSRAKVVEVQLVNMQTGRLKKTIQYDGDVDSPMDLTHFPLDVQEPLVVFETDGPWETFDGTVQEFARVGRAYKASPVQENGEGQWIAMWWDGVIKEWTLHGVSTCLVDMAPSAQGQTFAKIEIAMHISRNAAFYLRKTLLPLYLLTFLSYTTFAFPVSSIEDRMANVATFFLACFTMLYTVGESLPKTDCLTKIDIIIMATVVSLALIGAASVLTFKIAYVMHEYDDDDTANMVNSVIGIIISSLYVIINLVTFAPSILRQTRLRAKMDCESFVPSSELNSEISSAHTYYTLDA
jgi:hypothetical protein